MTGNRTAFLWALAILGAVVHPQEFRAALSGRVLDGAGAPVPSARVRVTNSATAELRNLLTDSHGNYLAPLLNPGTYSVRAEVEGFKVAVQSGVQLSVNQTATLGLTLELGSVKTEILVKADVPPLDDASAERGGLIDGESVREYSLNARNPFMLAMLAPGVNFDGELTCQRLSTTAPSPTGA